MPGTHIPMFTQTAQSGAEDIAARLEEDIVLGLLAPQVRLIEDDLMARFQAKRHVVRAACDLLEKAGLVERKRNVGAMVRSFADTDVYQLYEIRRLLETEAMRLIPLPAPEEMLRHLHLIQAKHDEAVQLADVRLIFHSNQEFHRGLFGYCGNPHLAQAIEDFARRTHAIRFQALLSREQQLKSQKEHHQLLELLEVGDRETLLALTQAHLIPSRDYYLRTRNALGLLSDIRP